MSSAVRHFLRHPPYIGKSSLTLQIKGRLFPLKTRSQSMDTLGKTIPDPDEVPLTEASSSTVMQDLCKGIIKDPFTFNYEVHEECPIPRQIPDEKRRTVERFWRDAYLKSLNKAVSHVQDWFTKISFKNKVTFAGDVIGLMIDSRKLFDLAYFIGPPTKDYVYAHTQFTRSPSDVAAVDHNRALDDSSFKSQSSAYLDWFQSLNPREQFDAVIGLIHLGGTALGENIYGKVVKILEEKERDVVRKRVLQYLAQKRDTGTKFIASKVAKHKQKLHQPPIRTARKKTQTSQKHSHSEAGEDAVDYIALLQQKIAEYDNAIKTMERVGGSRVDLKPRKEKQTKSKGRKSKSSIIDGHKSLNRLNNGIDRVQMLPLWDNRRIIAMLPEKSTESMTKVNGYWKDMVDKTKKEMRLRKKLDKVLSKSVTPEGHKDDSKGPKLTKKTKYTGDTWPKEEEILPEDYHPHLDVYAVFSDDPPKLKPFSNVHDTYVICNEYCDDRAMDANKRWAAYSKKTDIELCNVVFGVPCNLKLENAHSFKISCVYFHPNEAALVFTGGYDGKVQLHDIWKKNVKMAYAGHRGIVSDVVANCRYVASCGMDKTIRVFNISDGRSMMCVSEDNLTPGKLLMTNCAYPLLYVATNNGEIVMYSIRDSANSKRIGKTVRAHHGEVTSLNHYPCVLLTSGVDGFVRMWATNFKNPCWILSLKHPIRVNAAVMSYRKIVSAGEDGVLRIWDVMTGVREKVVTITPTGRPILSMCCIQGPHSVKLVLNNEADIKVVEFPLKEPSPGKKLGRYRGSKLKPVGDFKKKLSPVRPVISSYDKRMMKLQMRQAVLAPIRPSHTLKSPPLLEDRQMHYQLGEEGRSFTEN